METPIITPEVSSAPKPGLSAKKVILIVLGTVLVTGGIAAAAGAWWVKHTLYPSPMQPVVLTPQEQTAFEDKLAAFSAPAAPAATAQPEAPVDPELAKRTLIVTEREVNAYLAKQNLGETVEVNFGEGTVSSAIILTAPEDFPLLAGQKVRMRLTFGTSLNPGQKLSFVLDDVSLGGISLPNAWLADLKGVDLIAKNIEKDPGLQRFLAGIQKLEVHQGELKVLLNK
jgi:hypothetical protein